LYGWKVGQADSSQRCLAYYCEGKDPCDCVKFNIDNKQGGLNGTESISYCCTNDATHMIYVDDFSGKGTSLANSGAEIKIIGNTRTEVYPLDGTKAVGKRYWLSGCLVFKDGDFKYLPSHDYFDTKPNVADALYCYNKNIESTKPPSGNWTIHLTIRDAVTNLPIGGASVVAEKGDYSVEGTADSAGVVVMKVAESGLYAIIIKAVGYITGMRRVFVKDHDVYLAKAFAGLSKHLSKGELRVYMNWNEEPEDMDLNTLQVSTKNPSKTCRTFWHKKTACSKTGVSLDIDNTKGGLNGLETITLDHISKNFAYTYKIWVDDYGNKGKTLETSGAQVTVTDGAKTQSFSIPAFDNTTEAGVRYWVVGCMAIVGESYEFVPVNKFERKNPSYDQKTYCHDYFKENPPAGKTPPAFCPNANIAVHVFDALTNKPVANASLLLEEHTDSGIEDLGASVSAANGISSIPVNHNGKYSVSVGPKADTVVIVNCDPENCGSCNPAAGISLPSRIPAGGIYVMLNWGAAPADLDLVITETFKDDAASGCVVDKVITPGSLCYTAVKKVENAAGGLAGGETFAIKDDGPEYSISKIVYMLYVDSKKGSAAFGKSGPRLTITDGVESETVVMDSTHYNSERYWVVGCLQSIGEGFELKEPAGAIFLEKSPAEEMPNYCHEAFDIEFHWF